MRTLLSLFPVDVEVDPIVVRVFSLVLVAFGAFDVDVVPRAVFLHGDFGVVPAVESSALHLGSSAEQIIRVVVR